jgi:hypothetical protein
MVRTATRWLGRVAALGTAVVVIAAGPANAAKSDRWTGSVTGAVSAAVVDGTCPRDAFFPNIFMPHQRYAGTVATGGGVAQLTVDVCVSSDGGALGGNTFTGTFSLAGNSGSLHGNVRGRQVNTPNEQFFMTFGHGNGSGEFAHAPDRLGFVGCWGTTALDDAVLTTTPPEGPLPCGFDF